MGQEDPWDVRSVPTVCTLGVTYSEPLSSFFLLPGMIIPTCHTLAPSQVIPTLERNLVQRNSASLQTITVLSLAWPWTGEQMQALVIGREEECQLKENIVNKKS